MKLRVSGDYLQTSAVVRDGRVVSAVNDPNDYRGPGTGYRLDAARREEIHAIRDVLDRETVLAQEEEFARHAARDDRASAPIGPAAAGTDRARGGHRRVAGVRRDSSSARSAASRSPSCCRRWSAAIEAGGGVARVVRMQHTADTSFLGLSAARLSGSGVGIGIQAKGTAVIHHADRLPHNNLELFSNAPITTLDALPPARRQRRAACAGRAAGAGRRADRRARRWARATTRAWR